jgi:hypothetical protein
MLNNDEQSHEPLEGAGEAPDALAERMRREAMEERPAFSMELHRRIVSAARGDRMRIGSRPVEAPRWPAVAAAALAACALAAFWATRWHRAPLANPPGTILSNDARSGEPSPNVASLTIDFGGIFTADVTPAGIAMSLPRMDQAPATAPSATLRDGAGDGVRDGAIALPGSPQWLFEALAAPTGSGAAEFTDVLPAEMRAWVGLPERQ